MDCLIYLTYNSAQHILRNWASVTSAANPLHVQIIDNASSDQTVSIFSKAGIPVHVNPTNIYYSAAINQGIKAVADKDPEWIFLLNPDVECPPQWDSKLVSSLTAQKDVGIVGARLVNYFGNTVHTGGVVGKPRVVFWPVSFPLGNGMSVLGQTAVCTSRFRHRLTECNEVQECAWVTFAAVALRKKMLDEIGLLDCTYQLYCSDSNLCMRAWQAGWKVIYNPVTFKHEGSASVRVAGSDVQAVAQSDLRRFALTEEEKWLQSLADRLPLRM